MRRTNPTTIHTIPHTEDTILYHEANPLIDIIPNMISNKPLNMSFNRKPKYFAKKRLVQLNFIAPKKIRIDVNIMKIYDAHYCQFGLDNKKTMDAVISAIATHVSSVCVNLSIHD